MASAQVLAMPVDASVGKERHAAEDPGAAQDVYVRLKSLQKHMEFLDIQVGAESRVHGVPPYATLLRMAVESCCGWFVAISRFRCFFLARTSQYEYCCSRLPRQ